MKYLKKIIREYKKRKYYEQRAKRWKEFKKSHPNMECGLVKNPKWLWEKDCDNCSYDDDFFEKYGCMYVKDFEDY